MFKLHVLQAEEGDCLMLEAGDASGTHHVLIDGGPNNNFVNHLEPVLMQVGENGGALDLIMLSHVDTDHANGLIEFLTEQRRRKVNGQPPLVRVGGLWHNEFSTTIDLDGEIIRRAQSATVRAASAGVRLHGTEAVIQGVSEGHALSMAARTLDLTINAEFGNQAIVARGKPEPKTFGPLTLTPVGPTQKNLDRLRELWFEFLDDMDTALIVNPAVAASRDRSPANLSSLMVLAEADGKTVLLTGDGRGHHLTTAMMDLGLLPPDDPLHVDVLKMPHHGSERNVRRGFFDRITADRYVFSANGKHDNPDLATLAFVVEAAKESDREVELIVTNETRSTNAIVTSHPPVDFGYTLTTMPASAHALTIDVNP